MERRVKERLVGATILGLLVVLIVPELLSGPKRAVVVPQAAPAGPPFRSVTVDLATNKATADAESPGAASSADATPATNAGTTAAASDSGGHDAAALAPAAEPPTAAPDAAPAPDATAAAPDAVTPTPGAAIPAPDAVTAAPDAAPPAPVESGASFPTSRQAAVKAEAVHHGWVAQLGSFATRGNAEKLERQLRSQGYAPFISATGSGRGSRYRIRVGPFTDRAAAEKVTARLRKAGHPASVIGP